MLQFLKSIKGPININGTQYASIDSAIQAFGQYQGQLHIELLKPVQTPNLNVSQPDTLSPIYKIKVRAYMTRPSTPEFDFHTKMNNDIPMPLRIMVGRKLQETPGMVKMELWGELTEKTTQHCMKCGRVLQNKVSQYFGIGPECGGHNYTNPFETEQELQQAVDTFRITLRDIKWTGWIIKSAIEMEEVIYHDDSQSTS